MRRSASASKEWTTSTELIVELADRTETTKSARLRGALRDAIRNGRLEPGGRLPSSRALAADLGLSRGLVVETYEQLVAEGYLVSEHGSGTSVAANATAPPRRAAPTSGRSPWLVDFEPGTPDVTAFPRAGWAAAIRASLRELADVELAYRDPRGDPVLRTELASYLRRVRGAAADPDHLFVVTGFTHGVHLVSRALASSGFSKLAVEDPGAYIQRAGATSPGLSITPMPVDADGIRSDLLAGSDADAVMVTPAHQYPLGGVLAPDRRSVLLEWARADNGRLIIEDDYDAEFRYDKSPVGTLHGLAPEHVALGGSVSKSLAPALRLGWIAVPPALSAAVERIQRVEYAHPSIIDQRAFALLLSSGRYDRHIRRSRATYRARRDALLEALSAVPGSEIGGVAAGLHVAVELPRSIDEGMLTRALAEEGVFARGLGSYRIRPGRPGLVLGYSHLTPDQLRTGAAAVVQAVRRQC